jgi:hypothetical protein
MGWGVHVTVEFPERTTGEPGTFTTCVATETDGPRAGKPGARHVIRAAFYEHGGWEWSDTTPVPTNQDAGN